MRIKIPISISYQLAYIRFASVYRQFQDIRDFVDEVRPILDRNQLRVEDDSVADSSKPTG